MQQVLVTGATGYIGRNVVRELLSRGIRVIGVAHQDEPVGLPKHPLLRYYGCDLSNIASLTETLSGETIDCVYHFAWAGTEGGARADVAIQLQNVQWAVDMLKVTKALGCKRFIGVGTITKNEVLNTMALQGAPLRPVATYGAAKIAAQSMCQAAAFDLGVDFIWVDLANVYGIGDLSNTFIAATLKKILSGDPLQFSPGTQNYDFVYIDDVARGFVAIGEKGKPLHHYLIGSSHPQPLKDFILEIKSAVAPEKDFQIGAFPAVKGAELSLDYFDCSQTEQDTGFRAQVPFAEGIRKTFAWLKEWIASPKAIITGANGFIGSAVTRELLNAGYLVYALDREGCSGNLPLDNPRCTFVPCTLEALDTLPGRLPKGPFDLFYHFAWQGSAGVERADTKLQLQNAQWTVEALRIAHALGCKRFVGAGSIMEHETAAAVYTQGNRPSMGYIYGSGKVAAHAMCTSVAASLGIEIVWASITNAYGVGERSPRLVNSSIQKLLSGKTPSFTAGTQTYDFVYIDDVARAFRLIGEKGKAFREYRIGSGHAKPLRQFLEEMQQAIAPSTPFAFGEVPFTGVNLPFDLFDCSQTKADTGFEAQIPFAEGCRRTYDWWKTQIPEA